MARLVAHGKCWKMVVVRVDELFEGFGPEPLPRTQGIPFTDSGLFLRLRLSFLAFLPSPSPPTHTGPLGRN